MSFFFDYRSAANSFGGMFQDCSSSTDYLNSLSTSSRNNDFSSDESSPKSDASYSSSNLSESVKTNEDNSANDNDNKPDLINLLKEVSDFNEMSGPLSNETDQDISNTASPSSPDLIVPKMENLDDFLPDDSIIVKTEDQDYPGSFQVCPICGNEAGKHVHYGGRACTSCRAFFRRSVQNDAFKKFFCSTKTCKIDSKSWRSCKWCRFEKCLASGLQPGWVLSDTERQARQEKRKCKNLGVVAVAKKKAKIPKLEPVDDVIDTESSSSSSSQPKSTSLFSSGNSIHWGFTDQELMNIRTTIQSSYNKLVKNFLQFYANNSSLYSKLTSAVYSNSVIPYQVYKKWEQVGPLSVRSLAATESKLATLQPQDMNELLRHNFTPMYLLIQSSLMMNRHAFKHSFLAEIMTRALTRTPGEHNPKDVETLHDVMKGLNVGSQLPPGALSYSQVFASPWADSLELETRHAQLVSQIGFWPIDHNDPDMPVDYAKLFLLCNIFLFNTDRVVVRDRERVSQLQDLHMNMLLRYLKYKYKEDANSHLIKGLTLLSMAREVLEIRSHRLPV